ncbi:hypothetical protein B0H16DRAFT_1577833 [Mycena metata]|uniref:Uncharacterized protein n=1 Tax=Mycena metata TaxID=1033252 RepID=A0AAD7I4P7_9AGAR|nr:hypothetical protein B0H16DRAFT_1577833 [Mycena metata]
MVHILSEFLEYCASSETPFNVKDTISTIGGFFPRSAIHSMYQTRFTSGIENLFNAWSDGSDEQKEILYQIIHLSLFDAYRPYSPYFAWIDSPEARETLKSTLKTYLPKLLATEKPHLIDRLQSILGQLDVLHAQEHNEQAGTSTLTFNEFQLHSHPDELKDLNAI